ncbi:TBC1 domain family member 2B-like [Argiope bruennichi]|uniref:TBC1 domain family member 2B-like n=1 Tax=Argiope bruennichi TaxID=94029 RepID=UPI0024959363|nr:TBC1 domain family member 2B-like [Argiope bruennichi]
MIYRLSSDEILSTTQFNSVNNAVNGISSSSDSDVGESRLSVLQNELISVKCELAKCLNREKSCKMALEVKEAELQKLKLERDFEKKQREMQELRSKLEMLQNRNRFLNDEIQKLSRMLQQEQFRNHSKQLNLQDMSAEVDQLKRDYVFLLQSCIRITCTDGPEMMELYMYGEKRHKQRVFALLEEARKVDSSLPNLEGMTTSLCHVDSLGFKHLFVDKSLILHYVCRQLHRHYSTQLRSYERHVAAWKRYLKKHPNNVLRPSAELKTLVRGGVPEQLRGRVWSALYRMKVQDLREAKGPKYFENLCSRSAEAEIQENHKRQISLDLLRTMPNNIHFCDRNAEGIQKLQSVLHAFCLHNPKLGYCQGMNFLVGMMLLFVDAEDAFWCLVAIVERYFPSSYFDQNLIGAQADQELLKELLRNKLPKISAHLAALDIELSTVTLNWFLSLFIDSVPIELHSATCISCSLVE